jgi:hypothetical protein
LPVYIIRFAQVHQGTRATLTPPYKYRQGVRGDSMSPATLK